MKKTISLVLAVLMAVMLCACGGASEAAVQTENSVPSAGNAGSNAAETAEGPGEAPAEEPDFSFTPIRERICYGASAAAALLDDGTVSCSLDRSADQNISVNGEWLDWKDVVDISMNEEILAAVKADGSVVWCGGRVKEYEWLNDTDTMGVIDTWQNMVQVATGPFDIAALRDDGSVEITGSIWTEDLEENGGFVQVAVYDALVCLRENGTVYCFAPSVYEGQTWEYDVSGWTDIVQVSAGFDQILGLKADGTVVATGCNDYGQCDTDSWSDIVQVYAGRDQSLGLKKDGTVVISGGYTGYGFGPETFAGWSDIVEVTGFFDQFMGLKSDGTIIYAGPAERYNPVYVTNIKENSHR